MTQDDLNKILELHEKWLNNDEDGVRADLRGANLSYSDLSGANLRGATLFRANLTKTNLKGVNLYGASLVGTNLSGATLVEANLRRANLVGADLEGADLSGANLEGANLEGAFLYGANLENTCVKFIRMSRHTIIKIENMVYIGCQCHPLDYWLENYVDIGKKYCYIDEDIEEYGKVLNNLV